MFHRSRLAAALLFATALCGQDFRATLTGHVTDPSGSSVPMATVAVRNVETNETTRVASDSQGNYTAPFLRPGSYTITVEAQGFKTSVREAIRLILGQVATADIVLELGAVSDRVTVTADAELLDTAKADRGTVIDNRQIREFPLNARNPLMLSALSAGVNNNAGIRVRPFDNGAMNRWTVNGSQISSNEFLLDGAPNNGRAGLNDIAYVPPVDAVQEFKVQTNSYDAQYGKTGGGVFNFTLKSGTNEFHGSAYEFARRNAWDTNSFQNNARGIAKSAHYLDQFGFLLSGPIRLPKLYDGRNKSFFMTNIEKYREGTPTPLSRSVPEPEMRNGDFSKLVDAQGRGISIFDPATGRDINGIWVRDVFAGNRIPSSRLNPIASKIIDFMPGPNAKGAGQAYAQQNLFLAGGVNVDKDDFYNLVIKLDQNFGDRHRMFFRHASNDRSEWRTFNGLTKTVAEDGAMPGKRNNDAYVLDWLGTLSATTVVNVRGSFSRYVNGGLSYANEGFDLTSLGFPSSLASQIPGGAYFGRYEFSGYVSLGRVHSFDYTNTWALHPSISTIKGSHSIKAGLDLRWINYNTQNIGWPFRLISSPQFTQREFNRADALSGNAIASFLLGTPSSGGADNNVQAAYLYRYFAPYLQDDWKVSRRLTLNLGLRWDANIPANERYNRLNRGFDAAAVSPIDPLINRAQFPNLPIIRGGMQFAGLNGVPTTAANLYKSTFQPRIGFAFQAASRLILRGGWGRYYINPDNAYLQSNGFSLNTPIIASLDGNRTIFPNLLNNPFPSGIQAPPGSSQGLNTFAGRGFSFVNPEFKIPSVNQFSFGLQHELPGRLKVDLTYAGSRTKNLQTIRAFNEPNLSFRQSCNLAEGGSPSFCDQLIANPFYGLEPFRGTTRFTNATLSRAELARPYPQFVGLTELTRNDGAAWYNSLQATVEARRSNGLNLIGTYTFSKTIEQTGFQDVQRNIVQRSLAELDVPHRATLGAVYQLPFGTGHRMLHTSHPFWSRVVNGWESNVMFEWSSGQPWALPGNVFYLKEAKIDNIDWSAHKVYGVKPCVARWNDNGSITMQAYSVAAGCSEANFLIAPRYGPARLTPLRDGRLRLHTAPNVDFALNKSTRVTEKVTVQFRTEVFNLTNTFKYKYVQFNNNPEDANFGSIIPSTAAATSTSYPRQIQFAVKVIF